MFEVLLEQVLGLVHDVLAHDDKDLSVLVRCCFTRPEVGLDDFDDSSLLRCIFSKLDQDRCKCSSSRS